MEKLFDINVDGYSIRSKIFCNDIHKIDRIIVVCHGFGGTKDNKNITRFAGQVYSKYKKTAIVAFDWPCHGMDARKKLKLDECDRYLEYVIDDIKKRFQVDILYAYAMSFGAYLILKHLHEKGNPFRKIALRSAAVNMYESVSQRLMTQEDHQKLSKGKEILIGYDRKVKINSDFVNELKDNDIIGFDYIDFAEDILMVHGTKDEVIPFDIVSEFAENNVIEFLAVEKEDHRFRDQNQLDAAHNSIMEFFELTKD